MNLKEAFRFQNKLQSLMEQAQTILSSNQNIPKVETTYLRKKVVADAENETVLESGNSEYSDRITLVTEFLLHLLAEREKLSAAICSAKAGVPFAAGLDGEVGLNGVRQEIASLLRHMTALRASEIVIANGGTGYCFNLEGNQISYRCDIKRVTTINFDRNKLRKMCSELSKKADHVSAGLDAALINIKVDYSVPFDVNDTFTDSFEDYAAANTAA